MNAVSFVLEGKEYNLHFGMDAYEIIFDRGLTAAMNKSGSNFKTCCNIIYGGLVNKANMQEVQPPTWEEAFVLTEKLFAGDHPDIQNLIFDAYNGSVASNMLQKAMDNIMGTKKPTGKKKQSQK
jgi:hypothetical protein